MKTIQKRGGFQKSKASLVLMFQKLSFFCQTAAPVTGTHRLINYIDTKAKCRHPKKLTCKGLCGRCLPVQGPLPSEVFVRSSLAILQALNLVRYRVLISCRIWSPTGLNTIPTPPPNQKPEEFLFWLSFPVFSKFSPVYKAQPASRTIFRRKGGFRNNFKSHRQLSEYRNKLPEDCYRKLFYKFSPLKGSQKLWKLSAVIQKAKIWFLGPCKQIFYLMTPSLKIVMTTSPLTSPSLIYFKMAALACCQWKRL